MQAALEILSRRFPGQVTRVHHTPQGDDFAVVERTALLEVARFCKEERALDLRMFLSLCAVDRLLLPENDPRFELVYQLRQGSEPFKKLHLKVLVPEDSPEVPSVQPVWKGADWWERYTFDFYGIRFSGHPDLRRILLYEEFQGHPLRKDYPLKGRQPLIPERGIKDLVRGPGAARPGR
jgi:NADH-quinone oxidoreductase subunit C